MAPSATTRTHPRSGVLLLAARVLIAAYFLLSSMIKVVHFGEAASLAAGRGLPLAGAAVTLAAAVEFVGGALLVLGLFVRPACAALSGVLLGGVLLLDLGSPQQQVSLFQDLAVLGGLLALYAHGAGSLRFDARTREI